jgi:hypothetical protein
MWFIIAPLFLLISLFSRGQEKDSTLKDTSNVRIYLNHDIKHFEIKLTNGLLINSKTLTLPKGKYNGEIWAPHFKTKSIEFEINNDTILNKKYIKLERTELYTKFVKDLEDYYRYKKRHLMLPVLGFSSSVLATSIFYFKTKVYSDELANLEEQYSISTSPATIKKFKGEYQYTEDLYKKSMRNTMIFSGISLLTAGILVYNILKVKKKPLPTIGNDTSPFTGKLYMSFNGNINIIYTL